MKIMAGIMAFIVLFLTVQPAFAEAFKTEETACSSHCCGDEAETPAEEEQSEDPCSDFCNPLLKCGSCAATTMEFFSFSLTEPEIGSSLKTIFSNKIHSHFSADFWQPPRLA